MARIRLEFVFMTIVLFLTERLLRGASLRSLKCKRAPIMSGLRSDESSSDDRTEAGIADERISHPPANQN